MREITEILNAIQGGNAQAADQLFPIIYEELRRMAARKMAQEAAGHTLQPTALVHEAWLRLAGPDAPPWNSRGHFFSAAAEAMRRILVDSARRRQSLRRGAGAEHREVNETDLVLDRPDEEVLAVHEALDKLAGTDRLAADFVKLHYFVGMTVPEAAESLGVSPRSADRLWAYARTWLRTEIEGKGS